MQFRASRLLYNYRHNNASEVRTKKLIESFDPQQLEQLVLTSRHKEANLVINDLLALLNFRYLPSTITCFVALLAIFFGAGGQIYLSRLLSTLRLFLGCHRQIALLTWKQIRAIQFGMFWINIKKCETFSVISILLAESRSDYLRSLGWLGYSLSYSSGSLIGKNLLKATISWAKEENESDVLKELVPLYSIICYQSGFYSESILQISQDNEVQNAPIFYKVLTNTVRVTSHLKLGHFVEVHECIDETFKMLMQIENKDSRHFIQFYGTKAILSALEGQRDISSKFLAEARRISDANDNILDRSIYLRFEIIVAQIFGDKDVCSALLSEQSRLLALYGYSAFDWRENLRFKTCLDFKDKGFIKRFFRAFWHLFNHLIFFPFPSAISEIQFIKNLFLSPVYFGFPSNNIIEYLQWTVKREKDQSILTTATRISQAVSKSLASIVDLAKSDAIEESFIIWTIRDHFNPVYCAIEEDFKNIRKYGIVPSSFSELSELSQIDSPTRFPCGVGYIAYLIPFPNFQSELRSKIFCVILEDHGLDLSDVLLMTLEIMVTQYSSLKNLKKMHEVELANQKHTIINQTFQSLVHDMRAPIGVFERLISARDSDFHLMREAISGAVQRLYSMVEALRYGELERLVRLAKSDMCFDFGYEFLINKAKSKNISLVFPEAKVEGVYIDSKKLERAWINLVSNAIDFATSAVKLEVDLESDDLILRVLDDGPGVAQEFLPRLFKRGETYGKENGTGLGLAFVKQVVEGHGGHVTYLREDSWSIFHCYLPRVKLEHSSEDSELTKDLSTDIQNKASKKVAICLEPEALTQLVLTHLSSERSETYTFSQDRTNADIVVSNVETIMFEVLEHGQQEYFSVAQIKSNTAMMLEILKRKFGFGFQLSNSVNS